jgi:hypothetical protein
MSPYKSVLALLRAVAVGHGFKPTKSTWMVRAFQHHADFVHVHKFTGNPHIRLHAGIRVLNTGFPACKLNGPNSQPQFPLAFTTDPASWRACQLQAERFLTDVAEPWFARAHKDPRHHLDSSDADALALSLNGQAVPANLALSNSLLGLRS